MWHVLDVAPVPPKELAFALNKETPTLGWIPEVWKDGLFQRWERAEVLPDPELRIRRFPLQRHHEVAPFSWLMREDVRMLKRLLAQTSDGKRAVLLCTKPEYAAVAERWSGPVVYYLRDFFLHYPTYNPRAVRQFDSRLCRVADLICPNSQRTAHYLINEVGCPEQKIQVVPNATRSTNLLPAPVFEPAPLPTEIAGLPRPLAGVIGNLANAMNWVLLETVIKQTPWLSWVLVGQHHVPIINNEEETAARQRLIAHGGRVRFVGHKSYGQLRDYARSFDVAILPYRRGEPTYSGSSTKFYEYLATCRPMIGTPEFEELLHKEPLLVLTPTADRMVEELERLRSLNFVDGYEELRWRTSQKETWDARVSLMKEALSERLRGSGKRG